MMDFDVDVTKILLNEMYGVKKEEVNYPLESGTIVANDKLMSVLYSIEERQKIECAIGSGWIQAEEICSFPNYLHYVLDYDSNSKYLRVDGFYNDAVKFTKSPFSNYLPASRFSLCDIDAIDNYEFICGRLFLINHELKRIYEIRNVNDDKLYKVVLTEEQANTIVPNPYNTIRYEVHHGLNKCRKVNSIYDKAVNEHNKNWMYFKNRTELDWMNKLFNFGRVNESYFISGKTYYAYDLMMNNLYIIKLLPKDIKSSFKPLSPHEWFDASSDYKRIILNYFENEKSVNKAGELSENGKFFGSALGSTREEYFSLKTYYLKKEDLDFIGTKCFIVNESKKIMYCIRNIEKANKNPLTSKISKSIFNDGYFLNAYDINYNSYTQRITLAKGNDLPNNEQCLNDWSCFILSIDDSEFDADGYAFYLDPDLLIAYRVKKCN